MFERCKDGFVSKIDSQSVNMFPDRVDLSGSEKCRDERHRERLASHRAGDGAHRDTERGTFKSSRSGAETVAITAIARRRTAAASWDTFFHRSAELSTELTWGDGGQSLLFQ